MTLLELSLRTPVFTLPGGWGVILLDRVTPHRERADQRAADPGAGEALSAAMELSGMCSHDGRFRASYMTS
jgi:hypothetical protein